MGSPLEMDKARTCRVGCALCAPVPLAGFYGTAIKIIAADCTATDNTITNWVVSVAVAATAGNGIPTGLNGQTVVFSPNVNKARPTATSQGAIDWACATVTNQAATGRALTNIVKGTLPAKYAPAECR